eukprot:TRINITY_DN45024_c0_g1_i1.p1 TRINITY_DN45024_c0_g1~~TRINITY_DN45024_c0_g1_i1.p1  ORF type:complete len:1707 (-),score=375.57 TRINITY_DN45024_c0_g1_i1:105-5225(-)
MGSIALPTLLYMIFASCFLLAGLLLSTPISAEMFEAVSSRFTETPWKFNPRKTIYDIHGGHDVYEWLSNVVVNELYREYPDSGTTQYCSEASPCMINEGLVDGASSCAKYLKAGDRNCPSYYKAGGDCCEACQTNLEELLGVANPEPTQCEDFEVKAKSQFVATSSVPNLPENCQNEEMPAWLQDLADWIPEEPGAVKPGFPVMNESFKFCPERAPTVDYNVRTRQPTTGRYVTVAKYNRVINARISMKRRKLVDSTSDKFKNAYKQVLSSSKVNAASFEPDNENMAAFSQEEVKFLTACGAPCIYSENAGYNNAGGFVTFFREAQIGNKDATKSQLDFLSNHHFFDMNQGSFVFELLFFNGNVNTFMYVAFVFEHGFSGHTYLQMEAATIDFSIFRFDIPGNYMRWALYCVVLSMLSYFIFKESQELSGDIQGRLSQFSTVLNIAALALIVYLLVRFLTVFASYTYLEFRFPMPLDETSQIEQFENIVWLARSMGEIRVVLSVSLCLVSIRFLALLGGVAPDAGIVGNSLARVKAHLCGFFAMFSILLLGFSFAGYFFFGARVKEYSTPMMALFTVVKSIMGQSHYKQVIHADPTIGFSYHILFNVFFLIAQQPLLSIIIQGYMKEKIVLKGLSDAERFPLKRNIEEILEHLWHSLSGLNQILVWVKQIAYGGDRGGSSRSGNPSSTIARLRDSRATRPRIRKVEYNQADLEVRFGKDAKGNTPAEDITLRASDPFYLNGSMAEWQGLMQYYVQSVLPDGPASEARVLENFRLVGISFKGSTDREKFRNWSKFYSHKPFQEEKGYQENAHNVLGKFKDVTLEFEGAIRPYSCECGCSIVFVAIFVTFALLLSMTSNAFAMNAVQRAVVAENNWLEYNPRRIKKLDAVSNVKDIEEADRRDRMAMAVLAEASNGGDLDSRVANAPDAVKGMSVGYYPGTRPITPGVPEIRVASALRSRQYNYGVMPNNFARLTLQLPCPRENPSERFASAIPNVLMRDDSGDGGCSSMSCMQEAVRKGRTCHDLDGTVRSADRRIGAHSGIYYEFEKEHSYGRLGGIVVGLGGSAGEARDVAYLLKDDNVLEDIRSAVFESVVYNGNFDLFVYRSIHFDLHLTGMVDKQVLTYAFPLNLFPDQGFKSLLSPLFILHAIFTFGFLLHLLQDLNVQHQINQELSKAFYKVPISFISEDLSNIFVIGCSVLNIMIFTSMLELMYLMPPGYEGSPDADYSWTLEVYKFKSTVDMNSQDEFNTFYDAAHIYGKLVGYLGLNGLFMMLRCVRYLSAVPQLRLMMDTISTASYELAVITMIVAVALLAFAFAFHMMLGVQFGDNVHGYGSLSSAFTELFLFLSGQFHTDEQVNHYKILFPLIFMSFVLCFYILMHMYMAALVFRWRIVRRDAQEFALKRGISSKLHRPKDKDAKPLKAIDRDFWKSASVLNHLSHLDETGRIREVEGAIGSKKRKTTDADHQNGPQLLDLQADVDGKKLLAIFKKAHMEYASQISRNVQPPPPQDDGAGTGLMVMNRHLSENLGIDEFGMVIEDEVEEEDSGAPIEIGIIEDPVEMLQADKVISKLATLLVQDEHPAEEICLDALVTVLEESGTLGKLQEFFQPPPMLRPKTDKDWANFKARKMQMQNRLNIFYRWLQEETRVTHYEFLKDSAIAKERVTKQQSLVLTEYLEELDEQIAKLQEDIRSLERRTKDLTAHVAPLL